MTSTSLFAFAMALVERNAAMLIRDSDVRTTLDEKLKMLLHDNKMQETTTTNLKAMAIKDADERIARKVIEIAGLK